MNNLITILTEKLVDEGSYNRAATAAYNSNKEADATYGKNSKESINVSNNNAKKFGISHKDARIHHSANIAGDVAGMQSSDKELKKQWMNSHGNAGTDPLSKENKPAGKYLELQKQKDAARGNVIQMPQQQTQKKVAVSASAIELDGYAIAESTEFESFFDQF